jgi:hypothetical protein
LKFTLFFAFLSILVFGSVAAPTWADVVPVKNASFETTSSLIACGPGCFYNLGPIPDWTTAGTGDAGSWQPTSAYPAPDGKFIAYSNGGTISQTLAASLTPNTAYTLSVDIGHRPDGLEAGYTIALYAGSKLLDSLSGSNGAIPIGTFADETLSFMSDAAVAPGNLRIVLTSAGPQVDFDDVRLMTGAPEPASLSLLAVGCGLMLFVFRRR